MIKENRLKRKLREKETVFGLFSSIPSPLMVEMIGCAGFDFVIIDTEHVCINPETLENMIRAAEAVQLTALVRVSDHSPGSILRVLDAGAQGIVVPHVRNREDAERIVRASRYYPEGNRSLNSGRPAGFVKMDLQEYIQFANQEILVIPMIEDQAGAENIDEILAVPGIDMILEGAADLSQSLGIPWQTRAPIVRETLQRVQERTSAFDTPYCAIPRVEEDVLGWQEKGVHAFVLGDERGISARAMSAHLSKFQQHLFSPKKI
jgi:2-keto-3-deoxy-L-rhamnonate aldolase RhmA